MNKAGLYISLLHGRQSPNEELHDWGFSGPIIGPIGIGYTYGSIKIFAPDWSTFEFLPEKDGCIEYQGKFYGDFEVWQDADPLIKTAVENEKRPLHSFEEFQSNIEKSKDGLIVTTQAQINEEFKNIDTETE